MPALSPQVRTTIFLLAVFVSMLLGMVGKTYYDHLTKGSTWGVSQALIPLLISPMVYGAIFSIVKNAEPLPALILGFQNGFFWQDVFSGLKPIT
jgi:hypothetical protein